jgi:hypothetical protein
MTYNDFIWKYNNHFVDYDGHFGNQCVDLIRQYIKDVKGWDPYKAIPAGKDAITIFNNFRDNEYFKKILNSPNAIPKKGDIIFYKYYFGLYGWQGHVELCDQADLYYMVNFSQNWPTGYPTHFIKRGTSKWFHGYRGCVGWLTPKK